MTTRHLLAVLEHLRPTKLHLVAFLLAASVLAPSKVGAAQPERGRHECLDRFGDPLPAGAVARIGTVRWWYGHSRGLVYALDGKSLVFRDNRGTVHVLDAAMGKEVRRIDIPEKGWNGSCFALAPNGRMLATGNSRAPGIRIWDLHTGKELRRIEGDKRGAEAVAFSQDGKTLAAGAYPVGMRLWDTTTWKETGRIPVKDVGYTNGIVFLPDGKTLISSSRGSINWWDAATSREIRRINRKNDGKPGGFYDFAVSPDGQRVAAINSPNILFLWDAATGKEIRQVELSAEFLGSGLCFSPDSRTLACGHRSRFFAADTGKELHRWDEGDNSADRLTFSPDGRIVAQVVSDFIRLRDVRTGKLIVPDMGLPDYVLSLRFSRDGKALITGCCGGRTESWNPLTGEPLAPLRNPPEGFGKRSRMLLGPALTAHGERAALVNVNGVLHVWEPATGKVCCRIAEPPVGEDLAEFSPDGKVVAVKHKDNLIRLWDAESGKLLRSLPRNWQYGFPHPHAFSPDGRTLAVAPCFPDKETIRLCETTTGKEKGQFVWQDNSTPTCLVFSPDGQYVLAAHNQPLHMGPPSEGEGGGNGLRLWDRNSGHEVRRFPVPGGDVRALAISPDGKTAAVADYDTILLWELASGAERGRFTGHREWIWSLEFSPDGRLLASGGLDYTACVWDVTGICPDGQWPPRSGKREDLERLWADLGHKDGVRAYRALWGLVAAGPSSVAFLAQRLRPAPRVEDERLARLVAELDSDRFETRERATAELQRLGEQAGPALRKALAAKPSLEVTRRLRSLLDRVERQTLTAEQLHALRAVEVLEHIGTAEARTLLRSLADGAPAARLTQEAKASLQRLDHPLSPQR